jgi:hypothetical protein
MLRIATKYQTIPWLCIAIAVKRYSPGARGLQGEPIVAAPAEHAANGPHGEHAKKPINRTQLCLLELN